MIQRAEGLPVQNGILLDLFERFLGTEYDMRRMREQYPVIAKKIYEEVANACDRYDYPGSFIYDETPEKLRIYRMRDDIYKKLEKEEQVEGIRDLIEVLIYNEIYTRRNRRSLGDFRR